jgi:hypothetical protein
MRRLAAARLFLSLALLSMGGCHKAESVKAASPAPSAQQKQTERAAKLPAALQREWTFLNRLRQTDKFDAIDRTLANDQQQLGVVLSPKLLPGQIESLLKDALRIMAKEFPGQDLTLNAYEPTKPLHKLGRAQLDGKTQDIRYEGAQ